MEHSFRAPTEHGQAVVLPPMVEAPRLIKENQALARMDDSFLSSIRARAREQMVSDAKRYTSAYRSVTWLDDRLSNDRVSDSKVVMAGHQPTIFHPGVWFKNFALDHLAKTNDAIPINLVIDNDVSTGCSLRIPTLDRTTGKPVREVVHYDDAGGGVPYEQTVIRNRKRFDSFDQLVSKVVTRLIDQPCIDQLWQHALAAIERCGVAGCALAQARHGLEGELGLETLELPLSVLCRGTAFAEFSLAIFAELPTFVTHYNDVANQYRSTNGIRSSAHPVSNLQSKNGWDESPFWVYGNDQPERKPVWAKVVGDWLMLTDRPEGVDEAMRTSDGNTRLIALEVTHRMLAAEKLASLITSEFKLRPRALVTTMYARLVLSDLFLHGIGGGKYDELGDEIVRRFFGVSAPAFMVISATIQLPGAIRSQTGSVSELRGERSRLLRALRDTRFQPERFAEDIELDPALLRRKVDLLSQEKRDLAWHREVASINEQLSNSLALICDRLSDDLNSVDEELASARLLSSREHPFAVFPLGYLLEEYEKLLE